LSASFCVAQLPHVHPEVLSAIDGADAEESDGRASVLGLLQQQANQHSSMHKEMSAGTWFNVRTYVKSDVVAAGLANGLLGGGASAPNENLRTARTHFSWGGRGAGATRGGEHNIPFEAGGVCGFVAAVCAAGEKGRV
jgi:hypothetical protein